LEYWSVGAMVNEKKQKQGLSETAGLDGGDRILQEDLGGIQKTAL
jgi:hypothetical protein